MLFASGEDLLDQRQHGLLVEPPATQVCAFPGADLELACLLGRRCVDAVRLQPTEPLSAVLLVDDVERLVAGLEAVLQEGHEDLIFFVPTMEEGAGIHEQSTVDLASCTTRLARSIITLPRRSDAAMVERNNTTTR